jgi:hypothetical protein
MQDDCRSNRAPQRQIRNRPERHGLARYGRNTVMMGRGEQVESSRTQWDGQTLVIVTTIRVNDRGAGTPFTAELTRKLWLESPTTLIVEATRAGVPGGPTSTTRSLYRNG